MRALVMHFWYYEDKIKVILLSNNAGILHSATLRAIMCMVIGGTLTTLTHSRAPIVY